MTNPDTLAGGVKLALHGPFKTDPFASYIYGSNDKVGGDTIVLDIRGWGYLTGNGHGALGLEHSAGMLEQKRFAEFVVNALNAAEAASPPKPSEAMVATHRHVKRGSEYELIGYGKMQAEHWYDDTAKDGSGIVDMREVAIYRSVDDGSLWVRPREEFEDGRFIALTAALSGGAK